MTRLEQVRGALEALSPRLHDPSRFDSQASVALVLAPSADDLDLLFIRRRHDPRDFWSGHTAFPGGRLDAADANARAAAVRETHEEVGVDLGDATPLGRLDDLSGRSASLVVSCFVYGLEARPKLSTNHEVDAARFVPLVEVESPEHHTVSGFDYLGQTLELPAVQIFEPPSLPLWGLSYRFLELFMQAIGRSIPAMPWDEKL